MRLFDVNLWVYAFRTDSPLHQAAMAALESATGGTQPFIMNSSIIASFLRLVSNPQIFMNPSPTEEAWEFIDALASRRGATWLEADAMTLGIFKHLNLVHRSAGNQLPDDLLAALAIRHDATLDTADAGFGRYQGLRLKLLGS